MNRLLLNGVYHSDTLMTLLNYGIKDLSFDLRPQSKNLVTFKDLHHFLIHFPLENFFLTFGNDKVEIVKSYLDLLKDNPNYKVIIRDNNDYDFFKNLKKPFYWMFDPEADWKAILSLSTAVGVLLPLSFQNIYKNMADLWLLIEDRKLDVFIHAKNFEEARFINMIESLQVSIDLTDEIEVSYRQVDLTKLKSLKIWRMLNENSTGQ